MAERAVSPGVPTFAALRGQAARSLRHPLTRTLLALTFTTGMVDAVSYLGLGLAADSRLAGGSGGGSARRIAAVIAMLVGALAGALMVKSSITLPLIVALALALVAGLAYTRFNAPPEVV